MNPRGHKTIRSNTRCAEPQQPRELPVIKVCDNLGGAEGDEVLEMHTIMADCDRNLVQSSLSLNSMAQL